MQRIRIGQVAGAVFVASANPWYFLQSSRKTALDNTPPSEAAKSLSNTVQRLKRQETRIKTKWAKDEESWHKLPSRSWPIIQPDVEEEEGLRGRVKICRAEGGGDSIKKKCDDDEFLLATCLLFNNLDTAEGLSRYRSLAGSGHLDSMVASGIVLVEGLGEETEPKEGSDWLTKAQKLEDPSGQADFELGCLFYNGSAAPFVQEDEAAAFKLFEKGANKGHINSSFMVADMLVENLHTKTDQEEVLIDSARAIELFYFAGNRGHRFSRQQLLAILEGRHEIIKLRVMEAEQKKVSHPNGKERE